MTDFAWSLIGPGAIAHRFAQALGALPGARLHSVLGRDAKRTAAFAKRWSTPGADVAVAPSLAELLSDPAVDAVYIATPHALHGTTARACLLAGKPVLCEKPLVPSLAEAQTLVALARERGVFLMEALWTRWLPAYAVITGWLRGGAPGGIGALRGLQSSFCFHVPFDASHRCWNPALAGGALLDIGIYNLSMTRWVLQQALGECPALTALDVSGVLAPTGVDQRVAATLHFAGGISAQMLCGFDTIAENSLQIFGSDASIRVPCDFWQATQAQLIRPGAPVQTVSTPFRVNGFEGEIEEAMACIRAGLIEGPTQPHAETLAVLGWIDQMRQQLGVRYPFE